MKNINMILLLFTVILLLLISINILRYNNTENFNSYDYLAYGTTPPISTHKKRECSGNPVADGNPYVNNLPIDPKKSLTKSIDNPFKAYNLGLLDYKKMIDPIITKDDDLNKYGDFKSKNLSNEELNFYNEDTNKNRANQINVNQNLKLKYIKSKIPDINKINMFFLKQFNKNQQLIVSKELIMKNGLKDYMIYSYYIKDILINDEKDERYQLIINLIKQGSYYNPTICLDGLVTKNKKVLIFNCYYIGQFNTSESILVSGYKNENSNENIPINYRKDIKITQDIDTVIKDRDKYLEEQKLTSQYACFNTDPSVGLGKEALYKMSSRGKPEELKEYTMLNYYDKEDCEREYDFLGNKKKRGVWDRPCRNDIDCPFYMGNKNYKNEYGKCNKKTGQCELPLNMMNIGYHYFYPEEQLAPLCYNCDSNRWLPMTDLSKCCDEQFDKKKYPFLNGPDYAFNNDYQRRINSYMQKNCKLKSLGKNNVDNNIVCKDNIYNLY